MPHVPEPESAEQASVPPEFEQIIAEFRRRGLHAWYGRWAMGQTVFVGAGEHWDREIHYFDRAAYLRRVGPDLWAVCLSIDDDAPSSLTEAIERAATFLATPEAHRAESKRRWRRLNGQS